MSNTKLRLTRRQAIGVAAGGAVGAAGLATLGSHLIGSKPSALASGSATSWSSPLGNARGLGDLLRRAGFGYTSSDLDSAASMKYSDLVDMVVNQTAQALPTPANLTSYTSVS